LFIEQCSSFIVKEGQNTLERNLLELELTPPARQFAVLSGPYATAKDHTIRIYGKPGVNRRWDAVAKAEELNILPSR
jgi:hypothetical protein